MSRIALGPRDRNAEHEHLAVLNGAHPAQHFCVGKEIQAADLVVGAPSPQFFGASFSSSVISITLPATIFPRMN
jgi:glutathione S-transferase